MTDEEQKKIFGRNLSKYIALSGKDQKEVAKELGYAPTTFNTWCVGKIIPSMGKVQHIADYFGIGKSDLLDDRLSDENNDLDFLMLTDDKSRYILQEYYKLDQNHKDMFMKYLDFLSNDTK